MRVSGFKVFASNIYETEQPVVRIHPETGEKSLVLGQFVQRMAGQTHTDSTLLFNLLQGHVTRPENIVRWSWSPNQLVIFDNRITQHYAIDNYDNQPRRLNRVTVAGDIPVGADGRPSRVITGDASAYSRVLEYAA